MSKGFTTAGLLVAILLALSACEPLSPEEQARLRGKTPPAVSLGVSPNADAAASRIEPAVPIGKEGFSDNFERLELGPDWLAEGRAFRIESGQLATRATGNRGLWLRRALPRDVRIEFTVRAEGTAADIKLEVFGDGQAADSTSGYIVIFGGWSNTLNVIARRNENGADRVIGPARPIVKGQTYRMRIERRGRVIEAFADEGLLARLEDPAPLEGPGHQYFAFNGWQSDLYYDNLVITPL